MITKIYFTLWLAVAGVAGLLYGTGNFGLTTAVAFGFIVFSLVFMGMMSVLPATIAHPEEPASAGKRTLHVRKSIPEYVHDLKGTWNSPDIQMRKPNFH